MRIPVCFLAAGVTLVVILHQCSISDAAAAGLLLGTTTTNALKNSKPNLIDALKDALKDRALIKSGPEDEPQPRKDLKKRRFVSQAQSKLGKNDDEPKGNSLRQELAKETQDNCLARLLCGVQTRPQQTKKQQPFNPINDYAYLVKEFFDIFGGADAEDFKEAAAPEEEEKANDEGKDDDDDDDNDARSSAEAIEKVNITGSLEEVVSTSTSATIDYVTTGATITDLLPSNNTKNGVHKVTLEELVGDVTLTSADVQSIRQARNLLKVGELNKSSYIQRKIRELRVAESDSKKLRIAGQIVNSIRQPRQCKQFSAAASEILSTCPLTTEVVRYFNSNLKNGSQIALVKNAHNATEGGIVLLNDQASRPYAYLLDNSPLAANVKIATDLKNPTTPDRYSVDLEQQIYEHKNRPYNGAGADQVISIAQPAFPPASSKKTNPKSTANKDDEDDEDGSNEEDDDEENGDEDEDEEEEDDDGEEEDQAEDEGNDEESNNFDEDDIQDEVSSNQDYQVRKYNYNNDNKNRGKDQQSRKWKVSKKPKKAKSKVKKEEQPPPKSRLPPGMIKVYGIPRPSFDNEFSHTAGLIGSGPVVIFDQDDYDSHLPHPGRPPIRQPRPRPRQPPTTPRQRNSYAALLSSKKSTSSSNIKPNNKYSKTVKPKIASSEEEDEEDEDEEEEEEDERSSRSGSSSTSFSRASSGSMEEEEQRGRPSTSHYMTSSYGAFPAPRAEEYYRNGLPPRPRPVIPSQPHFSSSADRSRSESSTQIRGRLNFRPNTPGSGLIRPAYIPTQSAPTRGNYFSY